MIKTLTYKDLVLPEQLAVITRSAVAEAVVPIYFTSKDLSDLFEPVAAHLAVKGQAVKVDLMDMPVQEQIKKNLLNPDKHTIGHISNNALTMAFSLLGYASSLGREIKCMASGVDEKGQATKEGPKFSGHVSPTFFSEHESDPLSGARLLFGGIADHIDMPERMVVFGFVSPNPNMN